jgi:hypothetical protein
MISLEANEEKFAVILSGISVNFMESLFII